MTENHSHRVYEKFNHNREAVYGALLLSIDRLEWTFHSVNEDGAWVFQTGVDDAANNEQIFIKEYGNGIEMSSQSIGDIQFDAHENENNIKLLLHHFQEILSEISEERLKFEYRKFLEFTLKNTDEEVGWRKYWYGLKNVILFKNKIQITWILLITNVLVYGIMVVFGAGFWEMDADKLVDWGANYTLKTTQGQYWRLLTNVFLHGNLMHLFSNLYGLIIGGLMAERLLGSSRFLRAYLLCGIFASAVSLYMHDEVLSVGASGAIFGCFGLVLGMASTSLLKKSERKGILYSFGIFVAINLLLGFKEEIDNWAHLGGLLGGWLGGVLWALVLKKKENVITRKTMDITIPILIGLASILLVKARPNIWGQFQNYLESYDKSISNAFVYFPQNTSLNLNEVTNLHDSGLYFLNEANGHLNQSLKLPRLAENRKQYVKNLMRMNQARYDAFFYTWKYYTQADTALYSDSIQQAVSRYTELEKQIFPK